MCYHDLVDIIIQIVGRVLIEKKDCYFSGDVSRVRGGYRVFSKVS